MNARWILIGGAIVTLAACGGRSSVRVDRRDGGAATSTSGATTGSGGMGGEGGSTPPCPVDAFGGDRTGGVRAALDATHAYWTTVEGSIERGSLATGEVTTMARLESTNYAITLTDTHVIAASDFQILRVPKAGGDYESLAPGAFVPADIAAIGESIFFLDYGSGVFSGTIYEWTPQGGLVVRFEGLDFPRAFAVDATDVVVIADGLADQGEFLVGGVLARFSRVDFKPTVLAVDIAEPFGVEMRGETIFYGAGLTPDIPIGGRLLSISKNGGEPALVADLGAEATPVALAIDGDSAYVTLSLFDFEAQTQTSRLVKAPLTGGAPALILEQKDRFFTEPAATLTHVVMSVQNPLNTTIPDIDNALVFCDP